MADRAKLQVCYVLDEGYASPTLVSLTSLLYNAKHPIRIKFLTIGNIDEFETKVEKICSAHSCSDFEIQVLSRTEFNFTIEATGTFTSGAYAKLKVMTNCNGRWIYIDGDTIILDDLLPLYNQEIKSAYLGAVSDYSVQRWFKKAQLYKKISKLLNLTLNKKYRQLNRLAKFVSSPHYFNSGVMLLDCDHIRTHPQFDMLSNIELAHKAEKKHGTLFADQCWLNHYFGKQTYELPQFWNVIASSRPLKFLFSLSINKYWAMKHAFKEPKILHYAGLKPWTPEFRNEKRNTTNARIYDNYEQKCLSILEEL